MQRATRYSKKREAILAAIRGTNCHPSAEWVYQTLKPAHPDLSLGTVYRNLVFFQENGDIQSVGVVKGQERFDGVTTPHSHFICRSCGKVADLPMSRVEMPDTAALGRTDSCSVTFYGCCNACLEKKKA